MNIPEKVKVGGHMLDVVFTNNTEEIDFNNIGKTILAKNVIYINSNYPRSRQEECLLHELIHNCLYDLHEEQDESMVERLGVMLYMIIKDNPKIFNTVELGDSI
jgi:Zn-dependent peptidase ImmA (M78 family)